MGTGRFMLCDMVFRIEGFNIKIFEAETEFMRSGKKETLQNPTSSAQRMVLDALLQDIGNHKVEVVHHLLISAENAATLIRQGHWTYKELLEAKHEKKEYSGEVIVLPEIKIKIGSHEYSYPVWIKSNLPSGVRTCNKDGCAV